ncbi:MAG: preprotein translocase subunit SecY [Anaerolineales bacterium]|jgi:preprotein translocase subunit SecY|nr:preprotein translocase subunit SecY [Chloroflexota bacterium]MBK6647110.1 preprotein translocase subunit SecY [Anaerolineales bacterium]MCC6985292.1 preprotein translocase subunit SecY [Anaerolineales bacterium]
MKTTFSGWHYLWKSEDIRRKLIVTFVILVLYRLAANIPAPGVDHDILAAFRNSSAGSGGFLGFLDLLSGGTVTNFSLLSMGVYPYITAQIIIQLLIPIIPALQKRIQDDPREGRRWQEKWTYYLAVPMAALSAVGQINIFNSLSIQAIQAPILPFGLFEADTALASWSVLVAMTAGTMFAIWLGELISEYGIRGQGLSLIIFAGIVAQIPANFASLLADEATRWVMLILTLVVIVLTVLAIVYVQQGRRNVPVMYPGRRVGNRMSMPVKGTLPLMVNLSGMIPLIFASAILQFPAIIASYFTGSENEAMADFFLGMQNFFGATGSSNWGYWTIYFLMVVVFTFFYTTVLFDQQAYGDNLKKAGANVPGVLTGAPTQKYLSAVQSRITLVGAVFLGLVAIMPFLLGLILGAFNISAASNTGIFLITSSGLLIVVGVVRDTFQNIDAELKLHGYQDSLLVR